MHELRQSHCLIGAPARCIRVEMALPWEMEDVGCDAGNVPTGISLFPKADPEDYVEPLPEFPWLTNAERLRGDPAPGVTDIQRRVIMPATDEMKDHVYKILELVGSSEEGIEDAIENAVSRASKTIRGMKWFEVVQARGHIEDGSVRHYQVVLRVGFTLEE